MSKKITRDLGPVHAYALAVAEGFTGTKAEWEQLMAQAAKNAEAAEGFANDAAEANLKARQHANSASDSAEEAEGYANEAEDLLVGTQEALDNNSQTMAIWARNIGEMEGKMNQVDQANAYYEEIRETLDMSELGKRINRPNLLKQNYWTNRVVPTSAVVQAEFTIPAEDATQAADPFTYTVTDEGIAAGYKLYWASSSDWENVSSNLVSAQCQAGTAVITVAARNAHSDPVTIRVQLCTSADAVVPYGSTYRIHGSGCPYIVSIGSASITGQDPDDIGVSVIDLTGDDIITEADGETYNRALSFVCSQANTAWGNLERLTFNYGNHGAGAVPVPLPVSGWYGGELPMVVGKRYTMSCWARVTAGTKMYVCLGWDGINGVYKQNQRKFFEIEGGTWQRISFEFKFTPEGEQFYTFASGSETRQGTNWTRTVYFGVSRKYAGTVQLCGFRLTAGRLNMNQSYDELMDLIEELEERVSALENPETETEPASEPASLLSSAPEETGTEETPEAGETE